MILAVDARAVYSPERRGTGKNLIDLYRHVAELRPAWRIVMFHQLPAPDEPFADLPNVTHRRIDIRGDRLNLWQQLRLPAAARGTRADVLHCPANTAPRFPRAPLAVTIHDLIPMTVEGASDAATKWSRNVGAAARKAGRVITPSEFSRQEIARTFGVSTDKITVSHWAPDAACREVTDAGRLNAVRETYGLPADRPYLFGFGGADPRKNTATIIDAWALMPAAIRSETALLLVGCQEPTLTRWRRKVFELGLTESCVLHGFAAEQDIPAILSGATALCYASRSEGFGLPVLDAFVCGTAVLTSNVTSLPEVAGDAAVLVNPADPREIAAALHRLLTEPTLRDELTGKGRQRVARFTWDACATRAVEAFEQTAGTTEH